MAQEPEDFITVEEAARRLRIGRTRAYVEARRYVESGGAEGIIPAIPVGRLYRVPVARLEEIAGGPMRAFHRAEAAAPHTATEDPVRRGPRPKPARARAASTTPTLFDL
jgi:hypothetical protein